MKIEWDRVHTETIEDFATKHDLTLVISERPQDYTSRYFACFKHCEVKKGAILSGTFGNGTTPIEALYNYARIISGCSLVVHAMSKNRVEIRVPQLTVGSQCLT